jgi:nitroimidazol reductase NimA-like FMN-containing flavoprotein (pyridoxamine 5'-phosphate oxidase superfamily)
MIETRGPHFRDLDRGEVDEILARNNVGRIAFARENLIDIVPVHYVYAGDWIYGRTAPGGRVDTLGEPWWPVAFEVDEVDGLFDWRSVVVHGGLYIISPEGAGWERDAWMTGVGLLRKLMPEALREDDRVPSRSRLFRIAVQEVSGKVATSGVPSQAVNS